MSRQIPPANYTQIPNILLDSMPYFTHVEFKVAMFICRQTLGWHRERQLLSYSFIENGTGLSRPAVNNALITLREKGILTRTETGNSFSYALNVTETGKRGLLVNGVNQLTELTENGKGDLPVLVNGANTNKERERKKERIQVFEEMKQAINKEFGRSESEPWAYDEEYALHELCKCRPLIQTEFQQIVSYRRQLPANETRFFVNSVRSLLEKWTHWKDHSNNRPLTTEKQKPKSLLEQEVDSMLRESKRL